MEIKSTLKNRKGETIHVTYRDMESELDLGDRAVQGVHAVCFYGDKMVIVYAKNKGYWTPPGGAIEKGEDVRTATAREVKEETNMKVVRQRFIGYQEISEPSGIIYQTRSVCIVEPYGPFVSDPDEDITEIKLIDPKDYKQYIDWGEIGERIMARAMEIKAQMDLGLDYVK